MTSSSSYFINYCMLYLIQLLEYYFCLLYLQPLLLFLQLTLIYVNSLDLNHYLFISQSYLFICLDYLWRQIFELEILSYIIIRDHENRTDHIYNYVESDESDEDSDNEAFIAYYTSDTEYLQEFDIEDSHSNTNDNSADIADDYSTDNETDTPYSDSEIDKQNPFDYPEDEIEFYTLNINEY